MRPPTPPPAPRRPAVVVALVVALLGPRLARAEELTLKDVVRLARSTALSLLVVPAFYLVADRIKARLSRKPAVVTAPGERECA